MADRQSGNGVFGEDALSLQRGEVALAINGRTLTLAPGPAAPSGAPSDKPT